MTTTSPSDTVTNGKHIVVRWTPAILSVAAAAGLLSAGIIMLLQAGLPQNIPESAIPAGAPVRHDDCPTKPKWNTVPTHEISIPRRDIPGLSLILQDFTHRQGGCYYGHHLPNRHSLILPPTAIGQITELNRDNYAQWATQPKPATARPRGEPRQIDLNITVEKYDTGFALAFVGWIGLMVAMGVCFETAETDIQRRRQPKLTASQG